MTKGETESDSSAVVLRAEIEAYLGGKMEQADPRVAALALARKIGFANVGGRTLERDLRGILRGGGDRDVFSALVQKAYEREALARAFLKEGGAYDFISDLGKNWVLFEALTDGSDSLIAKKLNGLFPLLGAMAFLEAGEKFTTQDYEETVTGYPGVDWRLFDKAIVRTVGRRLGGLETNDFTRFQDEGTPGISRDSFGEEAAYVARLRTYGLLPLLDAVVLHLDVAKGGDRALRDFWKQRYGVDLLVHNSASAELIEREGVFEKLDLFRDPRVEISDEEKNLLLEFGWKMVAYHGFIGQTVRGEVTFTAVEGLTDWIRENFDDLVTVLAKLSGGEIERDRVPEFIAHFFLLVNLVDTAGVREGLYTQELHQKFNDYGGVFAKVITPDPDGAFSFSWDEATAVLIFRFEKGTVIGVEKATLPAEFATDIRSGAGRSQKEAGFIARRYFLADRIKRLRSGRISDGESEKKTEGLVFSLEERVFERFFDLSNRAQFWYPENATSALSVEGQAKLLFLAMRAAQVCGIDTKRNFDVSFINLMNTLRPNGVPDRARAKVVENFLETMPWERLLDDDFVRTLLAQKDKGVAAFAGRIGGETSVGVDFIFPPDALSACETINLLFEKRGSGGVKIQEALRTLEEIYGLSVGGLDRGLSEDGYMAGMDAGMEDKRRSVVRHLEEMSPGENGKLEILSLGAGTGALEEMMARLMVNAKVTAVDYSPEMIRAITEKAAVLASEQVRGVLVGEIVPLERRVEDLSGVADESMDAVVAVSFLHEVASFADNYSMGETTERVLAEAVRVLRPGGRLIIRDFVQPENPLEEIEVEIGDAGAGEMSPLEFTKEFAEGFKGADTSDLRKQITDLKTEGEWRKGARLRVSKALALEMGAHYSWAASFNDEVKERYAYFPLDEYVRFVRGVFKRSGSEVKVITSHSYLQPGYPEHVLGRLGFYDAKGNSIGLPPFTGVIVVEKA